VKPVTVVNRHNFKKMKTNKLSSKKQFLVHKIDLTKLQGTGDFLCPICKTKISPDDETEKFYTILEPKVKNSKLETLLIRCNNCSNKILLTGFSVYEI
jgi:DNA-directed RNA polymerase subunit RPC12/RpoP